MIESCTDVCQGTFRRAVGASKMTPESVRPSSAGRQLGKTFYMPVQGGEVTVTVVRAVGNHPLPISSCQRKAAIDLELLG